MSKLNVDQKSIKLLLSDKKSNFIIPDYQRPYAWNEEQCQTLWEDIFAFAIPDDNAEKFNTNEEYFLGSIVTFKNEGKLEVIDGQQRLTTIMLLLRAFYDKFKNMQDEKSKKTREVISECIWQTDEFAQPDFDKLKITSEVATDNDKEEFLEILKTGEINKGQKSNYAKNFKFFQTKINEFLARYPSYFSYLPTRILTNCILLPIEAESQDTALRIFSTLNDRGLPLSDADIFKAQFYKFYNNMGKKDTFIKEWKELEETCQKIFKPISGTAMDELFTKYMYYLRAKQGIKSSTTEALRKFYEKDKYVILHKEETLTDLKILAKFWEDIAKQDDTVFSEEVLKKLFILKYAPNGMWTYFVSVYFLQYKDKENKLDDKKFIAFLTKTIAFIWAHAVVYPGVNALRTPIYAEMINIVNNKPVTFAEYKFEKVSIKTLFDNYSFNNNRPITKSMLTWWAFTNPLQNLLNLNDAFDIEHIYAKNRIPTVANIEKLGNKILLEERINIRASDWRFEDKKKYYEGYTDTKGKIKEGSNIAEFVQLISKKDFDEKDISYRNSKQILDTFIKLLEDNLLIK